MIHPWNQRFDRSFSISKVAETIRQGKPGTTPLGIRNGTVYTRYAAGCGEETCLLLSCAGVRGYALSFGAKPEIGNVGCFLWWDRKT
jgi:hypothetical protein